MARDFSKVYKVLMVGNTTVPMASCPSGISSKSACNVARPIFFPTL